ncbi:MAG TPA: ATP-binding protein [Rudaea sp.]|jgi:anti-sigma regulatory factor (Ser/Thr protein kinase)|nr:ATP-binding protein [Rudaea sp.]
MAGWRELLGRWRRRPQAVAPVVTTGVVWKLRVERDRAAIGRFNERMEKTLLPSVPETALRALQISVDELLTNVLMHAQQATGTIDLQLARSPGAVDATIEYLAEPFDPTTWRPLPMGDSIDAARIGGHGIPLVRQLMDDFRYEHVDGRNILHLRKKC